MIQKDKTIREIIESEEAQFDNAWEHALYHLDIGTGVLFEEFEGRDHKKLYNKLTKIVNKIKSEYIGYCDVKTIITKNQYLDLKNFYITDRDAMNYAFPIRVLSHKMDSDSIIVRKTNEISPYLLQNLPWLNYI